MRNLAHNLERSTVHTGQYVVYGLYGVIWRVQRMRGRNGIGTWLATTDQSPWCYYGRTLADIASNAIDPKLYEQHHI